jgi:hypothetical protein
MLVRTTGNPQNRGNVSPAILFDGEFPHISDDYHYQQRKEPTEVHDSQRYSTIKKVHGIMLILYAVHFFDCGATNQRSAAMSE